MCEPLRGKKWQSGDVYHHHLDLDAEGWFKGKDVKSAVEFYKKYEDSETVVELDCPDVYEEYLKTDRHPHYVIEKEFRNWLFNHCFGDVIE